MLEKILFGWGSAGGKGTPTMNNVCEAVKIRGSYQVLKITAQQVGREGR